MIISKLTHINSVETQKALLDKVFFGDEFRVILSSSRRNRL